jgi:hypothetical protein
MRTDCAVIFGVRLAFLDHDSILQTLKRFWNVYQTTKERKLWPRQIDLRTLIREGDQFPNFLAFYSTRGS